MDINKSYFQNNLDDIFNIAAEHIMHDNMTIVKITKNKTILDYNKTSPVKLVTDNNKKSQNIFNSSIIYILIMLLLFVIMTIPIFFTHTQGRKIDSHKVSKQRKNNVMPKVRQ